MLDPFFRSKIWAYNMRRASDCADPGSGINNNKKSPRIYTSIEENLDSDGIQPSAHDDSETESCFAALPQPLSMPSGQGESSAPPPANSRESGAGNLSQSVISGPKQAAARWLELDEEPEMVGSHR